jgi:cellulose synthase/poly-beta-1,6-N-acetylglucosamine synthase-like glycosyltransferase
MTDKIFPDKVLNEIASASKHIPDLSVNTSMLSVAQQNYPEFGTQSHIFKLGEQLLEKGVINIAQLDAALEFQKQHGGRLGDILITLGFLSRADFDKLILPERQNLPLGKMLVNEGAMDERQLEQALKFQKKSGGPLGDIIITLGMATPDIVYRCLATQSQVGRIGAAFDLQAAQKLPYAIAKQSQVCLISCQKKRYLLAVLRILSKENLAEIKLILDADVEQVLASQSELDYFWNVAYGNDLTDESVNRLSNEMPENSARQTFTSEQKFFYIAVGLSRQPDFFNWKGTLFIVNAVIQILYFAIATFKMYILLKGAKDGAQIQITETEIAQLDERELPIYTILIPIFKEAQVIHSLLAHLDKMDYPKNKLDVRLLLEENDQETIQAVRSYRLPYYCTVLIAPQSKPQTKPKACNFGLIRARGEFVVIYDAEDRPEPDQLKKDYLAFKKLPEQYICVQAKLNYYNYNQNLLTKWFTQEYSMWFELLLPGIVQMTVPVPLGGTSNHFKTDHLKRVGAWDPFNVTEDADLGIRIFKEGYVTAVLDSRTWEEANSQLKNWLRQRSRWIKGYMQTWLVHMRHPIRMYREIGCNGLLGMQAVILGSVLLPLVNPALWLMIILWYATKAYWIPELFKGIIYYMFLSLFFIGNFYFIYSNAVGMHWMIRLIEKEKKQALFTYGLIKYALFSPIYWMLMSLASYKALWQLITNSFHWEKTTHGLTKEKYSSDNHT